MPDRFISKISSNKIERAFEEWTSSGKPVYEAMIPGESKGIIRQIATTNGKINSKIFTRRAKIKGTPIESYSYVNTEDNEPLYFIAEKYSIKDNGQLFLASKVKIYPGRLTTNTTNLEFTLRTSYSDYRNFLQLDWKEVDFSKTQNPLENPTQIIPATPIIVPENNITETVKSYTPSELSDMVRLNFELSTSEFKGNFYRTDNYLGASMNKEGKFNPSLFSKFTQESASYYPLLDSDSSVPISNIIQGTPLGFSIYLDPSYPNKYLAGLVLFDKIADNLPRYKAILETNDKSWVKTQKLDIWKRFQRNSST